MEPTRTTARPTTEPSLGSSAGPVAAFSEPPRLMLSPLEELERTPVGGASPLELLLRDNDRVAILGSFALGVFLGVLIRS